MSGSIDPELRISGVRLAVADLARSVDFYERVLGLPLLRSDEAGAELGAKGGAVLRLEAAGSARPAPHGSTGLFHVAWLHPDRASLAATVRRVADARWPIEGASDHGVSEALYLSDPDGLGIEIYADRPRELWERPSGGKQGVRMVTLALDLDDLLAQQDSPTPALPAGTTVGHVHMKVADVQRANAFYRDALGFEEQMNMPSAAFLSAGGYHHHVGLNTWQSLGGEPVPDGHPRLRSVEFALGEAAAVQELRERVERSGAQVRSSAAERVAVSDADGVILEFRG